MGISAINRLANMEYMLYGGTSGVGNNCPSYINGYRYTPSFTSDPYSSNYNNPYSIFGGHYPNYNAGYDTYTPSYKGVSNLTDNNQNTSFGASKEDLDILGDYYNKGMAPSESLIGAAVGGVTFGMMNNPRTIFHPINYYKATGATNKIFENVTKEGHKLNQFWKAPETTNIMQEAYARTHKLEALNHSKLGLFRARIKPEEYTRLKKLMEEALKSQNINEIAEATEQIKKATNAFTGYIPRGLRAIGLQKPMTGLRKMINPSQYEPVKEVAKKNVTELGQEMTLKKSLSKSCGIKSGIFFALMEFVSSWDNIKSAFSKDSSTGMTQLGQTTVKGVGSAAGWAIGEGIGSWAGAIAAAKIGAMAGTSFAPGVGTAIGAVAGLIGGSIGMWLTGKLTHKLVGQDVGEKVKTENMKKTTEGQQQLLQYTLEQAKNDKKLDSRTAQALQNVYNVYA